MKQVPFYDLQVTGGFWGERQKTVEETTVWAVYDRFCETGRVSTMNCKSSVIKPHRFWSSDVVKWMEGAAYILERKDDPRLKKAVLDIVDMIEQATTEDGYYNSYYNNPDTNLKRFTNWDNHELYSLGHMIEAAIAISHSLGDDRLLNVCRRNVDLVDRIFRAENSAEFIAPGHQEIELALIRLWQYTGEEKYRDLSEYFIRMRGNNEKDLKNYAAIANFNPIQVQAHAPVTEQPEAVGHAVRATYLFCAVADLAEALDDEEFRETAERIFTDIYERKMYITGGVGSLREGESFSRAYHLPNRTAYTETCAALGMALFSRRLTAATSDSRYGDAAERALFNGMISGLSLEGDSFFYENPLEIDRERTDIPYAHSAITERVKVFECSCCPPNLVRLIPSIADFIYTYDDKYLYVHQYIPNTGLADGAKVTMETNYPVDGAVRISYEGSKALALRKPAWCRTLTADAPYREEKGYLYFETGNVSIDFCMEPVFYTAADAVHEDLGRLALMRGPIVYCLEGKDQPAPLFRCRVDGSQPIRVADEYYGGYPILEASGAFIPAQSALYAPYNDEAPAPCTLRYIPFYTFANRGTDDMQVWVLQK